MKKHDEFELYERYVWNRASQKLGVAKCGLVEAHRFAHSLSPADHTVIYTDALFAG